MIVWASFLYQRRLEPRYKAVRDQVGVLNGTLSNNLGGIATIKAFTAEDLEIARVSDSSQAYREANRDAIRLSSAFTPLVRMAILLGFTMTLLVGGKAVIDGALAVGFFSILVFMTQRLLWPLTRLGETFDLYQRAMASTRRILDLLDITPRITEGSGLLPKPVAGAVRFEDVRFSYTSRPRGPPRPEHRRPRRGDPRGRRPHRSRQEHHREAAAAVVRALVGAGHRGRGRCPRPDLRRPARARSAS